MGVQVVARPLGPLQANCYVVRDPDAREALIIDPGAPDPWVLEQVKGFQVRWILLTHAHFDHIGGVAAVRDATGAPVLIHPEEREWLTDPARNGSAFLEDLVGRITAPPPDGSLEHGLALAFAGRQIQVRHTPGHSPGSVSLLLDGMCFSGDVLMYRSVGRTDLPGGDHRLLLRSIREQLLTLDDQVTVLPGHGPGTTIGAERRFNPFLTGVNET